MPYHSLPLSHRNALGKVKLEDVTELTMDASTTPHDPAGFAVALPFPSHPLPMNVALRDDLPFTTPVLNKLPQRHPWRKLWESV